MHHRVRAELGHFTRWLEREGVEGYVGEVGWPDNYAGDAPRWNGLARAWFRKADHAGLWVTQWSTGEWWGTEYKLAPYEDRRRPAGVDSADTQAQVLEDHLSTRRYRRGVNVSGGEFGTPPSLAPTSRRFSNEHPGRYGTAYHYDGRRTFAYLSRRGVDLIRLQFRWERIQPQPGGRLDPVELRRLRGAVSRATNAGLRVILDPHNYGDYYLERNGHGVRFALGTRQLPLSMLADLWRRLSLRFDRTRGVVGYALLNEPAGMPRVRGMSSAQAWERASQLAVTAIRQNDDNNLVFVQGYRWAGAQRWPRTHPQAWIRDPADNIRYEAHHYWDRDNSGSYLRGYAAEVRNAERRGF